MRHRWISPVLAALLILAAGTAAAGEGAGDDDPVTARVFRVHHKPLLDASEVVSALLSDEGQLTLQPRLKTLVVQDRESVLELIGPVLAEFDAPPRNVDISLSLYLAQDVRSREAGRNLPQPKLLQTNRDVQDVPPNILRTVTAWTNYESLGSKAVAVAEGGTVSVSLSEDYRVVLELSGATDSIVEFSSVTLQRATRGEDGKLSYHDEYKAEVNVKTGQTFMLGAAKNPYSDRALFLAIQARPR